LRLENLENLSHKTNVAKQLICGSNRVPRYDGSEELPTATIW